MRQAQLHGIRAAGFLLAGLLWAIVSAAAPAPTGAVSVRGYVEPQMGVRFDDAGPIQQRNVLEEVRALVESQWYGSQGAMVDLRVLAVEGTGDGTEVDLREGSIFVPVSSQWELTAGRQVLSWGPAQFEFINDHFAKDFNAFFLGRDLEFLKAPNDAVKLSRFGEWANVDLVLTPSFEPDRFPRGEVIPTLDPATGNLVDADSAPAVREPEDSVDRGEVHLRVHRTLGRWEWALYGYRGFTGTPSGFDGTEAFFPELATAGFSLRGPVLGSVVWLEGDYEDIRHPEAGETLTVPPDRTNLMVGGRYRSSPAVRYMIQGTWSQQIDASGYRALLPADHPDGEPARYRLQVARTSTHLEERLELTLRGFWGATEEDGHLRGSASYEWSDAVSLHGGVLLYEADHPASRFGVLENHDLVYGRLRYSF